METSISPSQIQLSTRTPQSERRYLALLSGLPAGKLPDNLAQVARSRTPLARNCLLGRGETGGERRAGGTLGRDESSAFARKRKGGNWTRKGRSGVESGEARTGAGL
jgi:hypothetical protein